MTFCAHGAAGPSVCGPCLIDSIQDGRPSAVLHGLLSSIEKEINRPCGQSPVSELPDTVQRLCDVMCHVSTDISRTYGLRLLFRIRGYLSSECLMKMLDMLVERIEIDPDTWTIGLLVALCLVLPYKSTKASTSMEPPATWLLYSLPQYTKMIGTYLEAGGREMLSGVFLLVYILALRLSMTLLEDHALVEGHEESVDQFHEKLQQCIKLCGDLGVNDKIVVQDMMRVLLCQEAVFSIIPLQGNGKRRRGSSGKHSQGQTAKIDKHDTEPDYKQILASIGVCFSESCLELIDLSDICYTSNNSALHIIYDRFESILSEVCEGFDSLQQVIKQYNVTTLINLFFLCPMHGDVTKATILRLLAGVVATHGVQHSGILFNSAPASVRDAFLMELNTMVRLKLIQNEIATASIVVSGIMSSKTSYSTYTACIEYLNEALQYPLLRGTADLLSLPVIVSRDDFPCFLAKIKCSPDSSINKCICNTKSALAIRYLNCKLKQGRIPSGSTLVEILITHCSDISAFDAITWRIMNETMEEMLVLKLNREDWYRLYQLLSPLLHILFDDTEAREDGIKDQEIKILKTEMLDNLMDLAAKYWMLQESPSVALLATAIDNLRLYGRGALTSMDSVLFWVVLSYLVQNRKPFDIVGTVSFILTRIDVLHEEPDSVIIIQRYLAVLIRIFLDQSSEYKVAETGRSLYAHIWRYIYQIAGQLQSFSCEEEKFFEYSLNSCGLLVQREESTRKRVQVICTWFTKKRQLKQHLSASLLVQLCFVDASQNYREVYPAIDSIFNRCKPEEYLAPLSDLPRIDAECLCNIVGLSSISPGFSTAFAGLILCKICCDCLRETGVIGEMESSTDTISQTEPSQTALDALERLFKRVKSKQSTMILPAILIVSMHLLAVNISNQSRTVIEAILFSEKASNGPIESANCETIWLYSALSLLLYIETLQDDIITRMLSFISEEHSVIKSGGCSEDLISTLLIIESHLRHPITIESACEIGVAMGTLSIHMHGWCHATPQYIATYFQKIEDSVIQNSAVKAMIGRGFVFFPGETVRKFTKLEDKLSWSDVIRGCNETGCLTLAKRLLFLVLTKRLYDKLNIVSIEPTEL